MATKAQPKVRLKRHHPMLRSATPMLRKLAPILALTGLLAAGCGADYERAGAQSDARAAAGRDRRRHAPDATRRPSISGSTRDGSAHVTGAFVVEEEGRLPKFAPRRADAPRRVRGRDVDRRAGLRHARGHLVRGARPAHAARSKPASKRRTSAQALAPDVSRWLANPRNEGVADVGGEETVKISGAADDKQVLADIERLLTQVQVVQARPTGCRAGRARRRPRRRSARSPSRCSPARRTAILRRLVVDRPGRAVVDLTLTRVGEDQDDRGAEGRPARSASC